MSAVLLDTACVVHNAYNAIPCTLLNSSPKSSKAASYTFCVAFHFFILFLMSASVCCMGLSFLSRAIFP